jgi:hypothetical protein
MKNAIFLDMTPNSLMEVYCCFRGTYYFHLQVERVSQAKSKHFAIIYLFLFSGLLFDFEDGGTTFL